jgi:hypothetical protein
MRELNHAQQGQVAGSMAKLPGPVEWPEGTGCPRVRTEIVVEVKNSTAGALDYTFARAKKAVACLAGFISNWFGDKAKDLFDNAITFAQLREFIVANTDDDVVINGKFYGDYADADVLQAAVAAAGVFNLKIEIPRPFELTRLGVDAALWAAGWSQMRLLHSEFKRLGAADFDTNGNFVQNKAAEFVWLADTTVMHDDAWANVPRVYVNQEVGKLNHAPAGELLLLSVYERTKTGLATIAGDAGTLGLFSLKRAGEAPVHENVRAARVATDALYGQLPAGEDVNKLVCPLHHLPQLVGPNDLPTGTGWLVEMPGAEIVGGAEVGYCYIPPFDESYAETIVAPNLVGTEQGKASRVKLVNVLAKQGRSITSKLARFAPRAIVPEGDAAWSTDAGDVLAAGASKAMPDVPMGVQKAATAWAGGGDDDNERDARATSAAKGIGKYLVGGQTGIRGVKTPLFSRLKGMFRR